MQLSYSKWSEKITN